MARPRLDRPVLGKPQRVLVRPRKKGGQVIYYYGYFVDEARQEHRIPGGHFNTVDRQEARGLAEDWLAGLQGGLVLAQNTAHARELFLQSLGRRKTDDTYRDYAKRTLRFCRFVKWEDIRKITHGDWERYVLAMAREVEGPYARKLRGAGHRWAKWMVKSGVLSRNFTLHPRTGETVHLPSSKPKPVRWIEFSDYLALRTTLAESQAAGGSLPFDEVQRARLYDMEVAIELGSLGLMPDEAARVQRFDVDREGQMIHVRGQKTPYRERTVAFGEDTEEILDRHGLFSLRKREFVCPQHFVRITERFYSCKLVQRVADHLDIVDSAGHSFVFYTLRRSCGVWMAHDPIFSDADIGAVLGHSPQSTQTARYRAALPKARLLKAQREARVEALRAARRLPRQRVV